MKRYILTGALGAGKTAILRLMESLGYGVVEEAATAVIALEQARGDPEPWTRAFFIDEVVAATAPGADGQRRWGCPDV